MSWAQRTKRSKNSTEPQDLLYTVSILETLQLIKAYFLPGVEVRIASLDNDATLKLGGKSSHTPPELFTSFRRYRPQIKLTLSTHRGRRDSHKVRPHSPASQPICAHIALQIPKRPKRILQQPQRHLVLPRLRRLVPHRRHRQARPARLSLDHRSSEGDDQSERVRRHTLCLHIVTPCCHI